MTEQSTHPITPPPELVEQWAIKSPIQHSDETWAYELFIAHQAARWGADQELEACCTWLINEGHEHEHNELRAARRPKPPSLADQALTELCNLVDEKIFPPQRTMTNPTPLSPAAQAVLDSANGASSWGHEAREIAAAALRAAADQVLPEMEEPDWGACNEMRCDIELYTDHQHKRSALLAIAAELDPTTTTENDDN